MNPTTIPHPTPPETIVISFSAEINPNTTESLLGLVAQQVNNGVKNIRLLLSTGGGSVMHGMNLYHVLRGLPIQITTHNVGNVDSIGNAVFLAGNPRYACPNATFMFHGVGFDSAPGIRLEEKLLKERLDSIAADHARIGAVIAERTGMAPDNVRQLFLESQTKPAEYARANGIVHDICEVQIPPGVPVFQLVFQR